MTTTTYLMLLHGDPDAPLDLAAAYAAHEQFEAACAAHGHEVLLAKELTSPRTARVLRVGGAGVVDGPYAETTEQLGGLYRVRTADPEGLLRLAAPLVALDGGTVELRPEVVHGDGTDPADDVRDLPLHVLLLRGDPDGTFDLDEVFAAHDAFGAACERDGHRIVGGEELAPHTAARLLRTRPRGAPVLSDGPYAETTEQLGGYYLVRTADPDALLRLAVTLVEAEGSGSVEVRGTAHDGVQG